MRGTPATSRPALGDGTARTALSDGTAGSAAETGPAGGPRHRATTVGGPRPRRRRAAAVDLREVTKVYGTGDTRVHALAGVDLVVHRGDYLAVMGASGSGKSTLMNIIGCLDEPTAGRYVLDGVDTHRLTQRQQSIIRNRKIGFVFQSFNLIPRVSALANVELPLAYAGGRAAERRLRATAALERVGLADRLGHEPSELSGGQQQRVALARAIVTDPVLLLADEPTGALDSRSTAEVLGLFDELNASGRTLVVITHESEVSAHAKRTVRMRDGLIVDDVRRVPVSAQPPLWEPSTPTVVITDARGLVHSDDRGDSDGRHGVDDRGDTDGHHGAGAGPVPTGVLP